MYTAIKELLLSTQGYLITSETYAMLPLIAIA